MQYTYLLLTLLPLITFVLAERYFGIAKALISSLIMTLLLVIYELYIFHELDTLTLIEAALLLVMGSLSVIAKNDRYFKLQPVVAALIFSLVLAYFQIFDQPLLAKMLPKMQQLMPQSPIQTQQLLPLLNTISFHLIFLFLIYASWVCWAAIHRSTLSWMWARLSIYPMMCILLIADSWFYRMTLTSSL